MADDQQLINVRTWKRFNQLLTSCLPIESFDSLLQHLAAGWLDIARAESVVVSILRHDEKSLLVARADRTGTSFQAVEAIADIWDEDAVLDIAGDQRGYNTPSTYKTISIHGEDRFDGGVILETLETRESRPLATAAADELTQLTLGLVEQALVDKYICDAGSHRPNAVAIRDTTANNDVPWAESLENQDFASTQTEFELRLRRAKLEAMAEFAAGAGHEINNPVASIAGRVELLLRTETNPERRQSLAAIGGQAYRVRDMIGDAMLFGRPPESQPVNCNLNEAVDEVIDKLQVSERGQTCRFVVDLASGVVVFADPSQLRVVISALISNAIESIREKGEIEVRTEIVASNDNDRSFGQLTITDNGIGMEARDREFLFDPFYSGRQAGRGLGFGLPKCWRIVDQHHGHIAFDSSSGGPTTFTVLWPTTEVEPTREDQRRTPALPETADQPIEERLEETGYRIPRRRRKRSF